MSWKDTLSENLKAISESEFKYIESNDIHRASEIGLNCSGLYMEATIIYFEIRNMAYFVTEHGRRKTVQIYAMFHRVLTAIAEQNGGFVNCYSPEALLVIFPGKEENHDDAVRTALKIAYALTKTFESSFKTPGIEFAMGMDHGHIMGTKNLSDNGLEQMSWFGKCIYKAIEISKLCARPYHLGVSSKLFHSLSDDLRTKERNILGIKKKVEVWTKASFQFENTKHHLYQTNHKISIDEEQ